MLLLVRCCWCAAAGALLLVRWDAGALGRWCAGTLVRLCVGVLVRWCTGASVLARWCVGVDVDALAALACWYASGKGGETKKKLQVCAISLRGYYIVDHARPRPHKIIEFPPLLLFASLLWFRLWLWLGLFFAFELSGRFVCVCVWAWRCLMLVLKLALALV